MQTKPIEKCIIDYNFKSLFIENPNALAHLISSITDINYYLLKDNITIKVNEIPISEKNERFKETDFVVTYDKYLINVEANTSRNDYYKIKNTGYLMELYAKKTRRGKDYNPELVFMQINLNAFNTNGEICTKYYICNPKTGEIYLENFIFYSLDIAKCYKLFYNLDEKDITDRIRWGAFLYCEDLTKLDKILGNMLDKKTKEELIGKVEEINMNADGIMSRREAKEWGRWLKNSMKAQARKEAIEEAKAEVQAEVRAEGHAAGKLEGREETIINTIKSMLKKGISYEDISDITNKTIDEIKEIENSIKE